MTVQTDRDIIKEAQERFKSGVDWESEARSNYLDDTKFVEGDSKNNWQWPASILNDRQVQDRPVLTINKTREHCIQVINDARQNKIEVKFSPTSGGATYDAAQVLEGIVRHIEYRSNADAAQMTAVGCQVKGGWGYWRLTTSFVSDDSFDQEINWVRVHDPLTVVLDPGILEEDGSDANWGIVYTDRARDEIEAEFGQFKTWANSDNAVAGAVGWMNDKTIRDAEYFRKRKKADVLYADRNGNTSLKSKIGPEIAKMLEEDEQTRKRKVFHEDVEWFRIIGDEIVEKKIWPGKYIPLFRVIGEEVIIEGQLDRKGHVRALRDPQRVYNFYSSAALEMYALQPKSPFVAAVLAIEGQEVYWRTANTVNHSVLPYNSMDNAGRPIPAPERANPPAMSQAVMEGLQIAATEMQMVSGQYQATMGEPSNEKSGRAINARQRQGDNATYHYIDQLANSVRFTGKAILDLIPKIYDTPRMLKIMGVDGKEDQVFLDPNAQRAYAEEQANDMAGIKKIVNPGIGLYSVDADVGPAYGTRRQEAFNAMMQLAGMSPEFMQVCGDLIVKSADFNMADELSERLERMVPAQALGGPPPQVMAMQHQIQKLTGMLAQSMQSLAEEKQKRTGQEQQKGIDAYKAETDRLETLKDVDPAALLPLIRQVVAEALSNPLSPIDKNIMAAMALAPMPAVGATVPAPAPSPGGQGGPGQ